MSKYKNNKEKAEYLENLVLLIENIISSAEAKIRRNFYIEDITGLKREFDVWIEQIVNKRTIITAMNVKVIILLYLLTK